MHRELSSVSCGDLDVGGMGLGWEMEIQKGGVIGLYMADSCCHIAEANKNIVKQLHPTN